MLAEISELSTSRHTFFVAISIAEAGQGAAAETGTGEEAWTECAARSLLTQEPGMVVNA